MKAIVLGYEYELNDLVGEPIGRIDFLHNEPVDPNVPDGNRHVVKNGTTNEEVLKMLIDRLVFQNNKLPSRETSLAITKLEECLMWLERRTKDREQRNVINTNKE